MSNKAPIARPNSTAAASGPSASKSHGTGEPFKAPKSNSGAMPNHGLKTESIATLTGKEPLPMGGSSITSGQGNADDGKGKTAAPISNNDVSRTHGS